MWKFSKCAKNTKQWLTAGWWWLDAISSRLAHFWYFSDYDSICSQTGRIPCAANLLMTQKTICLDVILLSSIKNGSTVLISDPYEDSENPFGPAKNRNKKEFPLTLIVRTAYFFLWYRGIETARVYRILPVRMPFGKNAQKKCATSFFRKEPWSCG